MSRIHLIDHIAPYHTRSKAVSSTPFPAANRHPGLWALGILLVGLCMRLSAASVETPSNKASTAPPAPSAAPEITKAQVKSAIDRGLAFLMKNQNSNGWWSTPEQPAVSALVLTAFNWEPTGQYKRARPSELNRAYDFILNSAKPDGSIHRGALYNYNTALCLLALSSAEDPQFLPVIRAARNYVAGTQIDLDEPGKMDSPFDGGVGYGSKYLHSDMNNTLMAIEAMRLSEASIPHDTVTVTADKDLNWAAVAHFLQNCQNLKSQNKAEWVSDDPKDRGGFVYYPGYSMAGGVTNAATGRVALRSYGSMSYGGLLGYIYAKVDKDDARVKAVLSWLSGNYTLDENPAMGQEGYYYYLHLMTKALAAAKVETLELADGTQVKWRSEVTARLLRLQQPDGSWVNQNERWWEMDKNIVTSYVLMALEILHGNH